MGTTVLLSSLAGLATGVGALIVVFFGRPSTRFLSAMLGFAAGIMLAVSAFDLLPEAQHLGGPLNAVIGLALGAGLMAGMDAFLPHIHRGFRSSEGVVVTNGGLHGELDCSNLLKCGVFLLIGIALHNLPEGLAIGAGYTSSFTLGTVIVVSLAMHNVPEGMVTATPLLLGGMARWRVVLLTTLAGMMTPIGTIIGAALFKISGGFVSIALAFAAGAMIYIVSDELIPQSHQYHSHTANVGLIAGFMLVFAIG